MSKVRICTILPLLCASTSLVTTSLHTAPMASSVINERAEKILTQMTLQEKLEYIGGYNSFNIRAIPRLQVPELKMADGPLGVRKNGPVTSFPAGICLASSWDKTLSFRVGKMLGHDAKSRGIHILLAPGMNICRSPLCGRNFEYFGEDPYLASQMAVHVIKGIQSQKVAACAKHLAANNQEWNRNHVSSDIDERTLREIYLPAFEASVKQGRVGTIMNAYNLINGIHATEHGYLNNEILKKEWGFEGILMSDWESTYDGIAAALGGLDLEMPAGKYMNPEMLHAAITDKKIPLAVIDDKVRRILRTAIRFGFFDAPSAEINTTLFHQKSRKVALDAALGGMVLLKNKGLLPLNKKKLKTIAVIGPLAAQDIPQGGGSSCATPIFHSSFLAGISDAVGYNTQILYSRGVPDLSEMFDSSHFKPTRESPNKGFLAEYFDNVNLEGAPELTRVDQRINFHWKEKSYRTNGPVNHYSARWQGYFTSPINGSATIYVSGNDRFCLYVDDVALIKKEAEDESFLWHTLELEKDKLYKIRLECHIDKSSQAIEFGIAPGENRAIQEAKSFAAKADAVVLCVGFGEAYEGEDWDRPFKLPLRQNELIQEVVKANKKTVVVMTAGGNVDMPWIKATEALLYTWYPGQEGGKALAQILFGKKSPSGKLAVSFERRLEDSATYKSYYDINNSKRVAYSEGIFIGYRHFDKNKIKPLFPFGFGLSYTTFKYSNLKILPLEKKQVLVIFDITNTGKRRGAEVAQVYVSDKHSKVIRPIKELKGFGKVNLKPGETKTIRVLLNKRDFSYYDVENKKWTMESGNFKILIGSSSQDIKLRQSVNLR
jgi:beta-glucosidase